MKIEDRKIEKKGKTAFQKIIDRHLVKTLPDGRMVLRVDQIWCHEITTPNAILDMLMRKCNVVFNPNKIKGMIDHVNPAKDTASAIQGKIMREWCEEHDIEFLDVGRNGIGHGLIPEKWPDFFIVGIMGDSHTCTHGANCSFTAGVGTTDLENAIITGLWICPPQKVIRVNFTGKLPANVFAKDLILALINKIGVSGATNAVLEFGGSAIDEMSMEGRMTMANMAVEAGGTSGMMMFDEHTLDYFWAAIERKYKPTSRSQILADLQRFNSDPEAKYDRIVEIDVSKMVPVITQNYSPGDVVKVSELAGKKVDQAYVGSCVSGRIENMRIAASIFRQTGAKVAKNTRCIIVPATQYIYLRALEEGLIKTFIEAGCVVSYPTCGACLGMSNGVIAPGEVCVATTNRNYVDRMGKGGMVHLTSVATAVLTAIRGVITEPTIAMCEHALEDCRNVKEVTAMQLTDWEDKTFKVPDYSKLLSFVSGEGENRNFSGKPFYLLKTDVDTDIIIPAIYLNETEKKKFGEHCLEGIPMSPEERSHLHRSQILVTLENFGCGSSREHAPWALEGIGIRCVIAPSFARIFENNMFANGLLCITASQEIIDLLMEEKPEDISIDWEKGVMRWENNDGIKFDISEYQKEQIRNGGSVGVMLKLASELQKEGKIGGQK